MKQRFRRLCPHVQAWIFCLSVVALMPPAAVAEQSAASVAPAVQTPPAGDENLERDIALGRFQTRLEQDIQLLERVKKLLETLRHLAPYTGVVDTLFSGVPEEDRLLQALQALRVHFAEREPPPAASPPPAPLSSDLPPPSSAAEPPQALLNFAAPAQGNRPGKAILRIDGEYKILYQGEELTMGGVLYRLEKVESDRVELQALDQSLPPYVVHWR